jgi:hypothetical protein
MESLIDKYHLHVFRGPLHVSMKEEIVSLDRAIEESESLHVHANPQPSYDVMFPLSEALPKEFDLYLLGNHSGFQIDTLSFIEDVVSDESLLLVGVQGIILFVTQHPSNMRQEGLILSPAYQYEKRRILSGGRDEAQIPFCFKSENRNTVGVGYSRFSACEMNAEDAVILIGKI